MTKTVSEFYTGKIIFTTGAAGFLGTFLLEVLLRVFPGIERIYILLRPKKGLDPVQRKELIFKKKIFQNIIKYSPELLDKIQVIPGDISKPNLGMTDEDMRKISEEATIVFHGAASISFTQPYRSISLQNAKGTDYVIEFCKKLKKLDVLVYTSTAYANCHIHPKKVEEKIYTLPYSVERILNEMEHGTDDSYAELVSSLESKWNLRWPNSYTFSKCVSENIILEKASDLPVAIVRPSIVFASYKGICPGYGDERNGIFDLSIGVGTGFVQVIRGDKDIIFDVIPIDIVANSHIIAAWCVATGRCPSMHVINCTSGDMLKLKFEKFIIGLYEMTLMHPLPKSYQEMSVTIVKTKFMYWMITFYKHYIPAAVLDVYLRFKDSKLRLIKLYRFFDKMMGQLHYFTSTTFDFQTDNFRCLSKELQKEEREIFYTDVGGASFAQVIESMPAGSDAYNWENDKLPQKKRLRIVFVRTMMITFIKRFTFFLIILSIYFIISKIFF